MEELTLPLLMCLLLTGCNDQPDSGLNKTSSIVQIQAVPSRSNKPQNTKHSLVNNPSPIPEGHQVDSTHLKQPMQIDFNGDGK